ncbi:MAG TPA: PRC-barrel domain-containing protein [Flavobacterium sp.]|jgi:hypothetical protein
MSEKKNKTLYFLDELPDYKVASHYSNVKGWKVKDADNRTIGEVDRLLVNKQTERVVYLDIEVDKSVIEQGHEPFEAKVSGGMHEFINKEGDNHLIIPIGMVELDEKHKIVRSDEINFATFAKTQRYNRGNEIVPEYETSVFRSYIGDDTFDRDVITQETFYMRREFRDRNDRDSSL